MFDQKLLIEKRKRRKYQIEIYCKLFFIFILFLLFCYKNCSLFVVKLFAEKKENKENKEKINDDRKKHVGTNNFGLRYKKLSSEL